MGRGKRGRSERLRTLRLAWRQDTAQLRLAVVQVYQALVEAITMLQPQAEPAATVPPQLPASPAIPTGSMLNVPEAAKRLTISAKTLYRLAALGQIPHLRVGRSLRFRIEDLDRWLEQRRVAGPRRRRV